MKVDARPDATADVHEGIEREQPVDGVAGGKGQDVEEGRPDPGWHAHLGRSHDAELTISIRLDGHPGTSAG